MITAYVTDGKRLVRQDVSTSLPSGYVWIDLLEPSHEQELLVEADVQLDIPTREEMQGIEFSNRLYKEEEALFMTATLVAGSDALRPATLPVTFVLTGHRLVTVRYHEPRSFQVFLTRSQKALDACMSGEDILIGLLEAIVDRLSDPLEDMAVNLDKLSNSVFQNQGNKTDFNHLLRTIGQKGDLNSKVKESLVSLDRLVTFLSYNLQSSSKSNKESLARLKSMEQDIRSLTDHANFLSNKINFMLDATLGMVNIEQNAIIKFFSVAAVIFMPPTLVASIYGMNFRHIPELAWPYGYPTALVIMLVSAIGPYMYFKHRGWL
jgi:magnesium transporter